MVYHSGNQLIDPYLIFEKVHLSPGMHVADLGCGKTGQIIFPAAKMLGERSLLYAVDIVKDVLEIINKRAKIENFVNVHTIWSDVERIGKTAIPQNSLDVVFLVNTLHQSENRHAILEEAKRLMKKKARLAIVDWIEDSLSFAPKKERLVNFTDIKSWAKMHGMAIQEEFLMGKYHQGIVLYRYE